MSTATTTLNALGVAPILTVNDLAKSIQYYESVGFSIEERYEQEGRLVGVRLVGGDGRLNLTQDDWAKGRDRVKGVGVRMFLPIRQDVDELATRIKSAGITLESEPHDLPWGRAFGLIDPDGYKVTIAREK